MNSTTRLRRTFILIAAGTLAVFAILLLTLTLVLRERLRDEVLQREANAIHAVARMEIASASTRLAKLRIPVSTTDVFAAVLESSRLSGVLAVQLYDAGGQLREALPAVSDNANVPPIWWPRTLTRAASVFRRSGTLEQAFGVVTADDTEATRTPLVEVAVPLGIAGSGDEFGVARYWIDGEPIHGEFRRMDQRLVAQAGSGFAGAAALVLLLLGWTYRRLAHAQAELVARTADLARANQELDFAAKTGALGAISAHLIHGLRNPLAGLEGFVTEAAAGTDQTLSGEARQTAVETARRLRLLVNEVVSVLRDEASGNNDYAVSLHEFVASVQARGLQAANAAGVDITPDITGESDLAARTANLAGLVLANLVANAIEAAPRGSAIRLRAGRTGDTVEFLVADEGGGLPEAVRETLFRPVQSTKRGGGGMGLAISSRLARHAGGELTLVRSDGSGTVFRLIVPAPANESSARPARQSPLPADMA